MKRSGLQRQVQAGAQALRLVGLQRDLAAVAFGDLGSYQLSYDGEDLMIFRFTPEGRYVDKFVQTMNSCGIALDNQSRVYISDNDSIKVFSATGEPVASVPELRFVDAFALDGEKAEDVAAGVSGYVISADGSKLLLRQGNDFAIVDAKAGQDPTKSKLAMDKLELRVDPRAEWQQEYVDAWRILRDWFYDKGVHGGIARWNTIRERYAPLVAHVATRADLAASFQAAIVDVLAAKCMEALRREGLTRLVVAGGVGANAKLRERLQSDAARIGAQVHFPPLALCTDNGAMIAFAAALKYGEGGAKDVQAFPIHPRWDLSEAAAQSTPRL